MKRGFLTFLMTILLLPTLVGCSNNPVSGGRGTTPTGTLEATGTVTVTFIDVGQGNATLVSDGFGNALIDFGRAPAKLATGLKKSGISHLDYIFVTHPDLDHYGAWKRLIDDGYINGKTVFVEPTFYMPAKEITASYKTMKTAFAKIGMKTIAIDTANQNMLPKVLTDHMTVLWPNPAYSSVIKNKNNNSLTMDIHTQGNDLFLTGDIENEVEKVLYAPAYKLNSMEVYSAAHHGGQYSSAPALINALKFQIAVISVGPNSYGHPHANTLRRLEYITQKYSPDKKSHVYRTDLNGTLTLDLGTLALATAK